MLTGYRESVTNEDGLYCFRCGATLSSDKVYLSYLRSTFPAQLLKCPICGLVYINEETAVKKALEIEKTIEEK